MILGLRSKNKRGTSVQVDYTIHIQEIRPWPPSQSLKTLRLVVLQWENGDRNAGSTSPVTPSLSDGKIEFNESFKLQVTFLREPSVKTNDTNIFQKNVLELNLYEPRRDRTVKGQLLGTAMIDLAEHGLIKDAVGIGVPLNCRRNFRNTAQPVLYVKIQPFDKDGGSSSSRGSSFKEMTLDRDGKEESVSALMNDEYAEEAEVASFTDDDVSSHSSPTNSSSALEAYADLPVQSYPGEVEQNKNAPVEVKESREADNVRAGISLESVPLNLELKQETVMSVLQGAAIHPNGSLSQSSSKNLPNDSEVLDGNGSLSSSPQNSSAVNLEKSDSLSMDSSSSTVTFEAMEEETVTSSSKEDVDRNDFIQEVEENMVNNRDDGNVVENTLEKEVNVSGMFNQIGSLDDLQNKKLNLRSCAEVEDNVDERSLESGNGLEEVANSYSSCYSPVKGNFEGKQMKNASEESTKEVQDHSNEIECLAESLSRGLSIASVASLKQTTYFQQQGYLQNDLKTSLTSYRTMSSQRFHGQNGNRTLTNERLNNLKFSVRSPSDSFGSVTSTNNDRYVEEVKEIDVQEYASNGGKSFVTDEVDNQESASLSSNKVKHISRYRRDSIWDKKTRELELRVELLEGELREAAAIEIGLYSIVSEHGSSVQKVHTAARRISRLYIHASRHWSRERRASAARSAVSGLVMAVKACGNDIPRLTFWLSNSVVLRAIVTQAIGQQDFPITSGPYPAANGTRMEPPKKSSALKWESSIHRKEEFSVTEEYKDWENKHTFTTALERIEAWIFSRIVESVWWQIFTPHMQSTDQNAVPVMGSHSRKTYKKVPSLDDQQQANFSIEIWKKAFKDACERLCPVRAEGHECGCLPMLARLVMEQCVARLDVAMFHAILRESDDEIPTDPVSDPISDSKVLPIPSGKSSFGAGAQLKNAIGNWSRWLTDLFGMDTDNSPQDNEDEDDDRLDVAETFKSFHFLNALSDLLMLPKDMLLESSIRKEVCPTFGASIVKQILDRFEPDEFCPDPIPDTLLQALDSEDNLESSDEGIRIFPCSAPSIIYSPPSVASIETIIGDVRSPTSLRRSGSLVVRKCHNSDDELNELDFPLTSIVIDKSTTPSGKSMGSCGGNTVRYQLLREVWRDGE